jgi:LPXTG-motif cell wall-anchored protein
MNQNQTLTAVLWIAAFAILILFIVRRRKRKMKG